MVSALLACLNFIFGVVILFRELQQMNQESMRKYWTSAWNVLDLGSGVGLIIGKTCFSLIRKTRLRHAASVLA
jgi:hypothetical protein